MIKKELTQLAQQLQQFDKNQFPSLKAANQITKPEPTDPEKGNRDRGRGRARGTCRGRSHGRGIPKWQSDWLDKGKSFQDEKTDKEDKQGTVKEVTEVERETTKNKNGIAKLNRNSAMKIFEADTDEAEKLIAKINEGHAKFASIN